MRRKRSLKLAWAGLAPRPLFDHRTFGIFIDFVPNCRTSSCFVFRASHMFLRSFVRSCGDFRFVHLFHEFDPLQMSVRLRRLCRAAGGRREARAENSADEPRCKTRERRGATGTGGPRVRTRGTNARTNTRCSHARTNALAKARTQHARIQTRMLGRIHILQCTHCQGVKRFT